MAGTTGKKAGHGTKKEREWERDKTMFGKGVTEGSRILYQALCVYIGLVTVPPDQVVHAKTVLREWMEDGSEGLGMDKESKRAWDKSIWTIFASIRESITQARAEESPIISSHSPLILPPNLQD